MRWVWLNRRAHTSMSYCLFLCVRSGSGSKIPDFWRNVWGHKEVVKSNTEVLKGHLSLTWKSVFVLLKTGICFRKSEFVLQNGGFVFKILADCKILAFQNREFKILADFKILAFQNPEFKILADFKILAFQNPEFKIFADFKILAFQNPEFKIFLERFNYCIVKLQFSNSDFLKQTPWFTNADFWKQTPIFKLRVLKTNFGFQTLIFGKKLPFTTLIFETKLLFSNSEFLKQTLIFEKKFQFLKTKKKNQRFSSQT